jgi:glycosyltransferase involved in cell wall biosynthesis
LGIGKATGDYITFIDADDNVSTEYISKIIDKINTSEFDYCMFSWKFTGDKDEEVIITGEPPEWNVSVWNCVYKRSIIGKFDERVQIIEDSTFNNAYRKGKRENITDILYHYLWGRKDSLTQKHSRKEIGIEFKGDGPIKTQFIIYRSFLSKLGGIETAVYNACNKLKDKYDIIYLYDTCDLKQLKRLEKLVKCVKFNNQQFECDIFMYYGVNPQAIEEYIEAKEFIQQICNNMADIRSGFTISPKTTKIVADSQASAIDFTKKYGVKCGVLHNLFETEEPQKILQLMTASRLSWEKGYERMKAMAKRMHQKGIKFTWEVFTNDVPDEDIDGFIYRKPRLDVVEYMWNKDYGIQLSDTESWGGTVTEFLERGVPMICTDWKSVGEQIEDGKNGFILKKDLSNLDEVIDNMYNKSLKGFKYNKKDSIKEWEDIIGDLGEKKYNYELFETTGTEVKALKAVYFSYENVEAKVGDKFIVQDETRLKMLVENKFVEVI